jgi:glycosyltransferase involved in cell wall biosynthesis
MSGTRPTAARWCSATVDLARPVADLETGGASWAHLLVTYDGTPLGQARIAVPLDPFPGEWLVRELADRYQHELALIRFRPTPPSRRIGFTTTVIVCTRDRPESLLRCLISLRALDPVPDAVIVVDNGSRDTRIRSIVENQGFEYVLEPEPGLDRARNRGLSLAVSDVVAYTDDDVEVDRRWLGGLAACFDDPLVMAATGLVVPALMDTEPRRRFEAYVSLGRGHARRVIDGTLRSPYGAGASGVGASMAFRAGFLRSVSGFPEELDAGMPTGSGGDTWALAEVLHAGYRIAYEPAAIAFHTHRETEHELRTAFRGYGAGLGSFLAASVIRRRDPASLLAGSRIIGGYLGAKTVRSLAHKHGATPLGLCMTELRGVVDSVTALPRARRVVASRTPIDLAPAAPAAPAAPGASETGGGAAAREGTITSSIAGGCELPSISVVIPSRGRKEMLQRLLLALDRQHYATGRFEIVVALDGDVDGSADLIAATRATVPIIPVVLAAPGNDPNEGNGAGVARNQGAARARGDLLVFLDDDVDPVDQELLLRHAHHHVEASKERVVVGLAAPCVTDTSTLFARRVRNWWVDLEHRLSSNDELSFADLVTTNVSVSKEAFERLGGFVRMPRREDWEFGYRVVRAGIEIVGAPDASVVHHADVDLPNALEDRYREGRGDAIFAARHPEALPWLSLASWHDFGPNQKRLIRTMFVDPQRRATMNRLACRAAQTLEQVGSLERYGQVLTAAQSSSYWAGVGAELGGEAGWLDCLRRSRQVVGTSTARFDVTDTGAWTAPQPGSVATITICLGDEDLAQVPVRWGGVPWSRSRFVETVAQRLGTVVSTAVGRQLLAS